MNNDSGSTMVDDPIPTALRAKALVRKTGEEEFKENGVAIAKLSEYWQWSASDLLGNTERGRLAEYKEPGIPSKTCLPQNPVVRPTFTSSLYSPSAKEIANPLKLEQWEFYVLRAQTLDKRTRLQKTISLSSLLKLGAVKVSYGELRDAIERSMAGDKGKG